MIDITDQLAYSQSRADCLSEKVLNLEYELDKYKKLATKNWNVAEYYKKECQKLKKENKKFKDFITKDEKVKT